MPLCGAGGAVGAPPATALGRKPGASGLYFGDRQLAVEPDARPLAHVGAQPVSSLLVMREEDLLEALTLLGAEVPARPGEHLVPARVHERRDLGHALVLALAVGRLGRVLHVEPQRGPRLHDLEAVLRDHEVLPQPEDLERNETRPPRAGPSRPCNWMSGRRVAGPRRSRRA